MTQRLAFGPVEFEVIPSQDLTREIRSYSVVDDAGARHAPAFRVRIRRDLGAEAMFDRCVLRDGEAANTAMLQGPGFSAKLAHAAWDPPLPADPASTLPVDVEAGLGGDAKRPGFALTSLLCNLLAWCAPPRGLLVLHAAGVICARCHGVRIVVGSSGSGKSTWAVAAGPRAFFYNAGLVDVEARRVWPLPWTGGSDPECLNQSARSICGLTIARMGQEGVVASSVGRGTQERDLAAELIADAALLVDAAGALGAWTLACRATASIPVAVVRGAMFVSEASPESVCTLGTARSDAAADNAVGGQ